jgi:hypothetical protein
MGPRHSDQTDQQLYPFNDTELERLGVYWTALAEVYTDACVTAQIGDERDFRLDWLTDVCVEGYPFTHLEMQRMTTYKRAVAIGLYTDGLKGDKTGIQRGGNRAELIRMRSAREAVRVKTICTILTSEYHACCDDSGF